MTSALLATLPRPAPGLAVLDFACGSGVIGGSILLAEKGASVTLLDAGALAIAAAKKNVSGAAAHVQSDCWSKIRASTPLSSSSPPSPPPSSSSPPSPKSKGHRQQPVHQYDWIVSNPPVHDLGGENSFAVVQALVDGAAAHLRPGGSLWIVAQELVPVGRMLARVSDFATVTAHTTDCRFVVWQADVGGGGGSDGGGGGGGGNTSNHAPQATAKRKRATPTDMAAAGCADSHGRHVSSKPKKSKKMKHDKEKKKKRSKKAAKREAEEGTTHDMKLPKKTFAADGSGGGGSSGGGSGGGGGGEMMGVFLARLGLAEKCGTLVNELGIELPADFNLFPEAELVSHHGFKVGHVRKIHRALSH
jgi:hypothetical protein